MSLTGGYQLIARSVDERLGGDGKIGVLEKAQDQFHLPRSRAVRRRKKIGKFE